MPLIPVTVQAFSFVYIGDAGSSSQLTRISDLRTNGVQISREKPTVFITSLGKRVQSGNVVVRVTLVFISDSDMATKITNGIPISGNAEDPVGDAQYSLFLLSPRETTKNSYYFPVIEVERSFNVRYGKDEATSIAITFQAEARSVLDNIMYKNTPAALDTIMGSKSPI